MSTALTGIEEFRQELRACSDWARYLREGTERPGLWATVERVLAETDRQANSQRAAQ